MKRRNPPYLLGLLCLIPLIGAFVGIGLMLYGIFYYKDKWLVLIGSAGLIFTVSIYSFLYYQLEYSERGSKGFAQISLSDLNSLVKDIEFYKLQKGVYPDSLTQIERDGFESFDDPLQSRRPGNKNTKYNYKRVGGNYYLYSSGVDGKPNTGDDIFPTLAVSDSSKIGWIKWR